MDPEIVCYRCKTCGCLWRLNPPSEVQPDGSWSLLDGRQIPGVRCCDNVAMDLDALTQEAYEVATVMDG